MAFGNPITRLSQLVADKISGASIDGGVVTGTTINGGNINGTTVSGGTVTGTNVNGGTITGTAINGATITGSAVNGGTVTGAIVQTASSGNRVVMVNTEGIEIFPADPGNTGTQPGVIVAKDAADPNLSSMPVTVPYMVLRAPVLNDGSGIDPMYFGKDGAGVPVLAFPRGNVKAANMPQGGIVSISTVTADTNASLPVTFPVPFLVAPIVTATVRSSTSAGVVILIWVNAETTTGFTLNIRRSNVATTSIAWHAFPGT